MQKIIVVSGTNIPPQKEANQEFEKLGPGWRIVSAVTTSTVWDVKEGGTMPPLHHTNYTTTIVAESRDTLTKTDKRQMKVKALNLSVRADNILEQHEVSTLEQLVKLTESDLLKFRCFGRTSLREVKRKLEAMGLTLGHPI